MSSSTSTTSPASFRIQIYRCKRHADTQGNVRQEYGELMWEEPPGRELTWPISSRWRAAQGHVDCLVAHHRCRVAVGTKSLFDDSPFMAHWFDEWPWSNERSLQIARDLPVLTAGIEGAK